MGHHQSSDGHGHGEEDAFFESLCEQIDDVYRTYRAGELGFNDTVQAALQQARRLLVVARPPSVALLTAFRANIAAAQIDELLAALPGQESRPSQTKNLAQKIGLTKLSQVRTTLVVGVLLAAVAFAFSSLVLTPRSRGGPTKVQTFGAGSQPAPTTTLPANNIVGSVVIVSTNQDDRIVYTGSPATGSSCEGAGGYADIRTGSVVTVTNGGSRVIATGQIAQGKPTTVSFGSRTVPACVLRFEVTGVPNSAAYGITVGHDGGFFDRQELVAEHWSPSLTFWG
jgi:hypothetical protein